MRYRPRRQQRRRQAACRASGRPGHRRIAMVNGSLVHLQRPAASSRLSGGAEAERSAIMTPTIYETSFGPLSDLSEIEQWLTQYDPGPPLSWRETTCWRLRSCALLRAREHRLPERACPSSASTISGPYAELDPFLTVVAQQAYQFGYIGMQLLIERIQNREASGPGRKSCCPPN